MDTDGIRKKLVQAFSARPSYAWTLVSAEGDVVRLRIVSDDFLGQSLNERIQSVSSLITASNDTLQDDIVLLYETFTSEEWKLAERDEFFSTAAEAKNSKIAALPAKNSL